MVKVLSSRISWVVLAVLAVVILVVGSGRPAPSAASARISKLDSLIKCPGCEDLSIAQSQAPSSVTLRNEVATWVQAGWTDQAIENAVVARFGPSGLLVPQARGVAWALYLVPIGLIGTGALCLGLFLWKRQRRWRTTT